MTQDKAKKATQKVLLPTLKEQQRYIVYEAHLKDAAPDFRNVHDEILQQCSAMLGIFDGAKAGMIGAKFNAQTGKGIIRVNSKYVDKLKICLGMIRQVKNGKNDTAKVDIDCDYVSGLLNKAEESMNKK
jgi:RNase P/RNase MRP subunit POP5